MGTERSRGMLDDPIKSRIHLRLLGEMMHPHIGIDNHTNELIDKLFDEPQNLAADEIFDLGKYYSRMLELLDNVEEKKQSDFLSAILEMKHLVYAIKIK